MNFRITFTLSRALSRFINSQRERKRESEGGKGYESYVTGDQPCEPSTVGNQPEGVTRLFPENQVFTVNYFWFSMTSEAMNQKVDDTERLTAKGESRS